MTINKITNRNLIGSQKGMSLPEVTIVLLIISIIGVLALPQLVTSRRLFRFAGMQREIVTLLREARQEAMSQRVPITFRYNNGKRKAQIFGGTFGSADNKRNMSLDFANMGLSERDVIYGQPSFVTNTALADGTNFTDLDDGNVDITYYPDGSVLDSSGNPQDFALYFFHFKHQKDTAFAISVLGAGGRAKIWKYRSAMNAYVE